MKFDVQGVAKLYLTTSTGLTEQQFESKFHEDNVIKASLNLVLSDGSTHNINVMELMKLQWCQYLEKENH